MSGYITGRASIDGVRINNPHRPDEIAFTGLALPADARMKSTIELWRAADLAERKRDGEYRRNGGHAPILANHADLALPWGTTAAEAQIVIDRVCEYLVNTHRVGVEYAVHRRNEKIDHIHFLWSSRTIGETGIGSKARGLNAIAQRQSKKGGQSAMEEIRQIASTAIREVCNTEWDHRSYRKRGIDKKPEPKLDQRRLREQRRRLEKLDISGPTKIERDLISFRNNVDKVFKRDVSVDQGIRRLPFNSVLEAALHMENQFSVETGYSGMMQTAPKKENDLNAKIANKPNSSASEDDDEWISTLIRLHHNHKIEEHKLKGRKTRQWIAQIDENSFDPNSIVPLNPHKDHSIISSLMKNAAYARHNRDCNLLDLSVLVLAAKIKKSFSYVMWRFNCYWKFLEINEEVHSFLPQCAFSEKELYARLNDISHTRVKPEPSSAGQVKVSARKIITRSGSGIGD